MNYMVCLNYKAWKGICQVNDLIKLWQNDTSRREFLKTYKDWRWQTTIKAYGLSFWEFDLPDGRTLIAMEHNTKAYSYLLKKVSYDDKKGVCYYIMQKDKPFIPDRMSESAVVAELKALKVRLQKGEVL